MLYYYIEYRYVIFYTTLSNDLPAYNESHKCISLKQIINLMIFKYWYSGKGEEISTYIDFDIIYHFYERFSPREILLPVNTTSSYNKQL